MILKLAGALGASAVVIALLLEVLKSAIKLKKKDLPTWVQILVPLTLSVGLTWVVWSGLELIGKIQIVALYALIVFLAQYYLSMELMKRAAKGLISFFLRKKGMSEDEIEKILGGDK